MTTRTTESQCPYCGKLFDSASGIDESLGPPLPGDYSVCISCGNLMVFDNLLRVAKPTRQQTKALKLNKALHKQLQSLQKAVRSASNRL